MRFLPFTFVIRTNATNSAVYTAEKGKTRRQRQLLQQYPDYPISGTCASCMVFFNTVLLFINFPEGCQYRSGLSISSRKELNCNDPLHFHASLNPYSYSRTSCNRPWSPPAALRSAITATMHGYTLAPGLPACNGHANRSECNARDATIR
jgi:hypothetical protein